MIERLSGLPAGVVGVRAVGKLTLEDYETVVSPIVDEITRGKLRLRVLVEIGPGFEGVTPAAAWDDVRLGLRAVRSFDGCAVVSDQEWIRTTSRVVGVVTPFPIRVFPLAGQVPECGRVRVQESHIQGRSGLECGFPEPREARPGTDRGHRS
jgi:hypothetical protein